MATTNKQINEEISSKIQAMMKESGAHMEGHFHLTSGLHSGHYVQCALMLRFPEFAAYAGEKIAEKIAFLKPDFILSPALGGLIIGHEVARALGIPFLFSERQEGKMLLRRFPAPGKKSFVLVEDVVTTGKSTHETAKILVELGSEWLGSASIIDRRPSEIASDLDLISLWKLQFPVYEPADCPLCLEEIPIFKPGSRTEKK